jgi:hypothetical protein
MYVCDSASQVASVLLQGTDRAKSGVLPVHTLILEGGEIPSHLPLDFPNSTI